MDNFDFIYPSFEPSRHALYDELAVPLVAPLPYVHADALSKHMDNAMFWAVLELDLRGHVNRPSGRDFRCIAYYADDPDVTAYCAEHQGSYLTVLGMPFVRRLAKVCQRLGDALLPLDLACFPASRDIPPLAYDGVLSQLLQGDVEVSGTEAAQIAAAWPHVETNAREGAPLELGAFVLFHDLVRLVWLHEWAHALCGHAVLARSHLGLDRLHEFSAERQSAQIVDGFGFPRNEVLQALEMHADEFAARYCVSALLRGPDPVEQITGSGTNLSERLILFNLACCIFAVMWATAEQRYQPGMTIYPPRDARLSGKTPLFLTYPTSHPPAELRYMRFRDFQRDQLVGFAKEEPAATDVHSFVDAYSHSMIYRIAQLDRTFWKLLDVTPNAFKSPKMQRLIAYEAHLLEISMALSPRAEEAGFVPTAECAVPLGD